jgi:hypothetical protein
MHDLHIDFNEQYQMLKVRQRFFTYVGIALCMVGLLTVFSDKKSLHQIISSSLNFILGLIFIIIQSNLHIFKWTKCYIDISDSEIRYKFWIIQRKTNIKWDSVKSLTLDFTKIYFDLKTQKTIKLNLTLVSDSTNGKIKESLLGFGNKKGIRIIKKNNRLI